MPEVNPFIPVRRDPATEGIGVVGLSATDDDVHRSLRRWFGVLLPEPWDIQYRRDEVTERPGGFVQPSTPGSNTGSAYVRENSRDFDAFLYPPGVEGNPSASGIQAEQLARLVKRAFTSGLKLADGAYYSRSMRLPVFDHDGVAWDQDVPADAQPFDHLPLSNLTADVRVDPDDDSLYAVQIRLRVRWREDGDVSRLEGTLLQDIRLGRSEP